MQNVGEIRLFPYDDVPNNYLECNGKLVEIKKYQKLYMMIGKKYGKSDDAHFCLPDLSKDVPSGMKYCIAYEGEVPNIDDKSTVKVRSLYYEDL